MITVKIKTHLYLFSKYILHFYTVITYLFTTSNYKCGIEHSDKSGNADVFAVKQRESYNFIYLELSLKSLPLH